MIIGPKYKIARRLNAPIFEKTQTQKYALREGNRAGKRGGKPKTDFGLQLNEKQKARMFYGITEKQFAKYVSHALEKKGGEPRTNLLKSLEHRLDNVVWRAGLLPTHSAARQAAAHGHFLVNGKKTYVPSYSLRAGDKITIREGSRGSKLWSALENGKEGVQIPNWLTFDPKNYEITIKEGSFTESPELLFDLGQVIEYYQR